MKKEEFIKILEKFTENNDFVLNPDEKHLNMVLEGILNLESKNGLKLCPCRLGDGKKEMNLELLCPCNFKIQENWRNDGRCWCGLFVKR